MTDMHDPSLLNERQIFFAQTQRTSPGVFTCLSARRLNSQAEAKFEEEITEITVVSERPAGSVPVGFDGAARTFRSEADAKAEKEHVVGASSDEETPRIAKDKTIDEQPAAELPLQAPSGMFGGATSAGSLLLTSASLRPIAHPFLEPYGMSAPESPIDSNTDLRDPSVQSLLKARQDFFARTQRNSPSVFNCLSARTLSSEAEAKSEEEATIVGGLAEEEPTNIATDNTFGSQRVVLPGQVPSGMVGGTPRTGLIVLNNPTVDDEFYRNADIELAMQNKYQDEDYGMPREDSTTDLDTSVGPSMSDLRDPSWLKGDDSRSSAWPSFEVVEPNRYTTSPNTSSNMF
jgi:hypothetical protein